MEFIKGVSSAPNIFNKFEHMYKEAIDFMDRITGEENGISLAEVSAMRDQYKSLKYPDEMKDCSAMKTERFCTNEFPDRQTQVDVQSPDFSVTDIKSTDAYLNQNEALIPSEVEYQMNSSSEVELDDNKNSSTQYDAVIDLAERNITDPVPVSTDLHQINVVFLKASTEYKDNSDNLITYIDTLEENEATMTELTDAADDGFTSLLDNELSMLEHPIFDEDVSFLSSQDILDSLLLASHVVEEKSGVTHETLKCSESSATSCSFQTCVPCGLKPEINETKGTECDVHVLDPKSLDSTVPIPNIDSSGRLHEHHQRNELITSMFPQNTNPSKTGVHDSWMNDSKMETLDLSQTIKPEAEATVHGFVHSTSHNINFVSHYTNVIRERFASRSRLSKEYKLLHIFHADIDEESKQGFNPSSVISTPSLDAMRTLASLDLPASEWEVL